MKDEEYSDDDEVRNIKPTNEYEHYEDNEDEIRYKKPIENSIPCNHNWQ